MKRANKLIQLAGFGLVVASLVILNSVVEWNYFEIIEVFKQII